MLGESFIEEIRATWSSVGFSRNQRKMAQAVPEFADLKCLLEKVYVASMKQEERRPVQIRIAFFPTAKADSLQKDVNSPDAEIWDTLAFAEPIELSVEKLRKIAPAFDQTTTTLVVARSNTPCGYDIVGALFYGRTSSLLDEDPGHLPRPPVLILSTRAPGSVAISYGSSIVGYFNSDHFAAADPGPFASTRFIDQFLHVLKDQELHQRYKNDYWFLYRDCVERIYRSAASRGHGSTIIWTPERILNAARENLRSGTKIVGSSSGEQLISCIFEWETYEEGAAKRAVLSRYKRRLSEYLDMLAQLSCVDKALVIDEYLQPVVFAAELTSTEWTGKVLKGTPKNIPPTQPIDIARFGTRHKSAINFIAACPGTVGFIISEDGPVRAITRVDDAVWFWEDCLNEVSLDG